MVVSGRGLLLQLLPWKSYLANKVRLGEHKAHVALDLADEVGDGVARVVADVVVHHLADGGLETSLRIGVV